MIPAGARQDRQYRLRRGPGALLGEAVCSAAKGGVIAFTKTMVRELARHRINVNCICPGPPPAVVVFLVSDEAAYITGQTLPVSGLTMV
jgi:2-hydroxycyclohexanecarboxyl-CoA dehydrogenase